MDLYSRKQRWKIFLSALAALIVLASLWYSNRIVNKISDEERTKVKLWAEAVQSRAQLVSYTDSLFERLREEERKKVEIWAEAMLRLVGDDQDDLSFYLKIANYNTTVPVVITDANGEAKFHRNLDEFGEDSLKLQQEIEAMSKLHPPIDIDVSGGQKQYLYYKDSKIVTELEEVMNGIISSFISETVMNTASVPVIFMDSTRTQVIESGNIEAEVVQDSLLLQQRLLQMAAENPPLTVQLGQNRNYIYYEGSTVIKQLRYFPFIQLLIIGLFLLVSYMLFSTFRKAEQNQVWMGMAKETAHQLGTPLSSLMAWSELLRAKDVDPDALNEIDKDLDRLRVITERFSKIGSPPDLQSEKIYHVLRATILYLRPRFPTKANLEVKEPADVEMRVPLNRPLFSWVVENLCRNAIDAMEGEGDLFIEIIPEQNLVHIDVSDTGKGIPPSQQNRVFEPGFTSKKRGWGLGLSLSKRIIEEYHNGKIFVKRSSPEGTTFRITLLR